MSAKREARAFRILQYTVLNYGGQVHSYVPRPPNERVSRKLQKYTFLHSRFCQGNATASSLGVCCGGWVAMEF